jgi:hypothetical protein
VDDHLERKEILRKFTDSHRSMLPVKESRHTPPIDVHVAPSALAKVVVERDEVPRRVHFEFVKETLVGCDVGNVVSDIGPREGIVSTLFIV